MGSAAKPRHMLRAGHPGIQQLIGSSGGGRGCNRRLRLPPARGGVLAAAAEPRFISGGRRESGEGDPASLQPPANQKLLRQRP